MEHLPELFIAATVAMAGGLVGAWWNQPRRFKRIAPPLGLILSGILMMCIAYTVGRAVGVNEQYIGDLHVLASAHAKPGPTGTSAAVSDDQARAIVNTTAFINRSTAGEIPTWAWLCLLLLYAVVAALDMVFPSPPHHPETDT